MTTKLIQSNFLTLGILTVISISSLSFSASHAFANPGDYALLNSASLSRDPLVSKTVHEAFTSHGSSIIW